ncbi:MAG: acetolactate decarboxylase, partial [Synergistaceae bacterium]|nr:acetolactate decarboxylase [Synergistaceae bacterium]
AGWHFHFISEDRQKGGHVLDLAVKDGVLELDIISEFAMVVPDRESFNGKGLSLNMKEAIQQVEGN